MANEKPIRFGGEASRMADKKVSGTVHIHVDDINSLKFKTLLTYCNALNYKYYVQSDKDVRRSMVGDGRA
jgi:hypothetical protein